MNDAFKAFVRGWEDKGKFPGFSPSLCLPYQLAVSAYFESSKKRDIFRLIVCDKDEDTVPFDFSYEVLPLAMAAVMAHIKSGGSSEYYRFITTALSALTSSLGQGKPDCEVLRLLKDPKEAVNLHGIFKSTGAEISVSDFAFSQIPWGLALDTVFPMRSVVLMKVMLDSIGGGGDMNSKTVEFARASARQFLLNSTDAPSLKKEGHIAAHIAEYFFLLSEIPTYNKNT